tara:strand:- start:131 stop:1306 length:1176 start_codon:yes stop_codon:yes gene_type:complete
MAHKLAWGSSFSIEDLVVNQKDDIYQDFPFLKLKENGLNMTPIGELHSPNENTVRGTTGFIKQKQQAIKGSIKKGWDRTSYPIPFLNLKNNKTIFDRRHTHSACQELETEFGNVGSVPTAEYERVYPKIGGIINSFSDESIAMMASMWGNVHGPIADDAKDHQFENTIVRILKTEAKKLDVGVHTLFSVDLAQLLFKYMGGLTRYQDPRTITRIPNNAHAALTSSKTAKGINTIPVDPSIVEDFICSNDDWQPTNTEDDDNIYREYRISKIPYHQRDVVNRLIDTLCQIENNHKEGRPIKKLKVLLWNEKQSKTAEDIVLSREIFIEELNKSWYLRRDNIIGEFPNELLDLKDNFRKKLNDFNVEIWCMKQLETEELHELMFDKGEWPSDD